MHLTGSESMAAFVRLKKELAAYRMANPDGEIVVSLLQFEAEDGCDIGPFWSGNCLLHSKLQTELTATALKSLFLLFYTKT